MKERIVLTDITQIGDPFVLHASDGKYYLYGTESIEEKNFNVYSSTDMRHWKMEGSCYDINERSFGYKNFWAPEVVEHNNKFIMHYSARWKKNKSLRIGVAVSDSPLGPFIDVYDNEPMFDFGYASIDGDVFIDDDNKAYLYFSRDCGENIKENGEHHSEIYCVRLSDDLLKTVGEAKYICGPDPKHPYEDHDTLFRDGAIYKWNEGPFVFKINGDYLMMYSANYVWTKYYSICAAKAKSPWGPFIKYDSPVATTIEGLVSGPGHNSVFKDDEGNMYAAYHCHTDPNNTSNNRKLRIDRLYYKDSKLVLDIVV